MSWSFERLHDVKSGQKRNIIRLTEENPAYVTQPLVDADPFLDLWIRANLKTQGSVELESGPYASFRLRYPWNESCLFGQMFATRGSVEEHCDDAGHTLGLVLIAEGNHQLEVAGRKWDLNPGCVYHIDTDKPHATVCDDPNGLLVIATIDFGWKRKAPTSLSYQGFAIDTREAFSIFAHKTPLS